MKKLFYYSMIGIILMTFASCNKKCKCKIVEQYGSAVDESIEVFEIGEDEEKSKCSDYNYKGSDGSYKMEVTCKGTL